MDFDTFIAAAWQDHATNAPAVAARLGRGRELLAAEADLLRLAQLAHHVHGAHLADWPAGIAFIEGLAIEATCNAHGASGAALRRYAASLALSSGQNAGLDTLPPSDRIRANALAASNLIEHDSARAADALRAAIDLAERAALPANDPMQRDLAVAGNNIACVLEEKAARSEAERDLMILAARTTRRHWERAGTWLEVERAEYRLANTWLQAGDPARAREHATACLDIVAANRGAALERFFGWEALGLAERAAGHVAGHATALARAREAFAELGEADQAWCAASVDKLAGQGNTE